MSAIGLVPLFLIIAIYGLGGAAVAQRLVGIERMNRALPFGRAALVGLMLFVFWHNGR